MKETEIMVICAHEEILKTIVRLVNNHPEMNATGVNTLEQAVTVLKSAYFDLVLLGSGLSPEEEHEFSETVKHMRKKIPVVHHYGGGSGLLFTEIYEALGRK